MHIVGNCARSASLARAQQRHVSQAKNVWLAGLAQGGRLRT
jgi:hypothetical protein